MLTKNSRRVVIIDKIKSDMIEQAIFILKGNENDIIPEECGLVAEAQGIIENYIKRTNKIRARVKGSSARTERRKNLVPYFALVSVTLLALSLAVYVASLI